MEELMSTSPCEMRPLPSPRPATLTLREDSHSISKPKPRPKIRIVHIFAPEIIKTDAANFRELVQRLTGKPAKRGGGKKNAVCRQVMLKKEPAEEREKRIMWRADQESLGGNNYSSGLNLGDIADGFFQGFSDFNPMLPIEF